MMSIIIDLIVVFIIAVCTYMGYKKGIVDVGFKLVAIIISLVVTIVLYSPITHLIINNTELDENIERVIIEHGIVKTESNSNTSSTADEYIQNYTKEFLQNAQNTAVTNISKTLAVKAVGIIVMIGLFIATRILVSVLNALTHVITELPIIKQCNEIGGIAYGLLKSLVIIYAILAIVFLVSSINGVAAINAEIEKTYITKFFYNNNVIIKLIK